LSNLSDAQDAYLTNADYAETDSLTKAKLFATACRKLLLLMPKGTAHSDDSGSQDVDYDPVRIENQLNAALEFIAAKQDVTHGGAGTRFISFENFR
jgi:hypothetical protein